MGTKHLGFPAVAATLSAWSLLALSACGGGGTTGPAGPAGPPGPGIPVVIGPYDPLPGIQATVTGLSGGTGPGGSFVVGNTITVQYTLTNGSDDDVNPSDYDLGSAYVSGPTSNYQRVIALQDDVTSASTWVGGGVWSYTFPAPIPAAYLAPYNDTLDLTEGELTGQALLAGTYSVGLEFHKVYTVEAKEFTDAATDVFDFPIGAGAVVPRRVIQNDNCNVCHTQLRVHDGTRKDVRLCVLCHTAGAEDGNDGGATPGRTIEFKVMVHKIHNGEHLPSVIGVSTDASGNRLYPGMPGAVLPEPLEYEGEPGEVKDYSEVGFPVWPNLNVAMPRDAGYSALSSVDPDGPLLPLLSAKACEDEIRTGVTACAKCHGDPDLGLDSNGPLLAPAQGDLHRTSPSRRACGSCHDDIDWAKPYTANGQTMLANELDASCTDCHKDIAANQLTLGLKPLSVTEAHVHPLNDAALDLGVRTVITGVTGGSLPGGNFAVGDSPTLEFTLTDDTTSNQLSLMSMDACSAFFLGPTTNRQLVMPLTSPNGMALTPFDFAGRAQAMGSGRGSMSKVFLGTPSVTGVLVVEFNTSSTHFSVTHDQAGVVTPLGSGDLPAATSTSIPSGGSISAFEIGPALGTSTVLVSFSDSTHFAVSGAVTGAGVLSNATGASTRFTSTDLSFNVAVGSAPFSASSVFRIAIFKGAPANPVRFAIVAGGTAFSFTPPAPDRFYYEEYADAVGPDFKYTVSQPMDIVFEDLGNSTGALGQALPAAGNLPIYYGRQQLWEATVGSPSTTSTGAVLAMGREMDIAAVAGLKNGDLVVIEPTAGIGVREFVQIAPARLDGVVQASAPAGDPTGSAVKLYFKTPLRYAHGSGVTVSKVTAQTLRQEGAANHYTLNVTTGVITANPAFAFTAGLPLVMSYRTVARFGHNLHGAGGPSLGRLRATYVPPANDSADIGQEQGDWQGLPYQDGTYTAEIWFARNIDLGLQSELQTYRSTSFAATKDFLFGGAAVVVPHAIIADAKNCYTCHNDVIFHGGGRRGLDACLTCHSASGNEDKPRWDTPNVASRAPTVVPTALTPGVPIEFRQMLHKVHRGSSLFDAATYTVVGNGGNPTTFGAIHFPAMPAGVMQCVRCHGSESWKAPADRGHVGAAVPIRIWGGVCGSCHDSPTAAAHISSNTAGSGAEACAVCHGWGRVADVEKVHTPK